MNILILSVGTRNKIVQYFKKTLGETGKVVVTDMSELAPAIYEADKFYQVSRITDSGYLKTIFDICKGLKLNIFKSEYGKNKKQQLHNFLMKNNILDVLTSY